VKLLLAAPEVLAGLLLIAVAVGLFVAEALVTSYGLLAVAGLVSLVLGARLLVDSPPDWRLGLALVLPTAAVVAGITVFLVTRVAQARRRRPLTGEEGLVGQIGELVAEDKVLVHGELWSADAAEGLHRGARVRIVAVHGSRLEVQPIQDERRGSWNT
jgi:membrane-bound serine protease (ClpP class)